MKIIRINNCADCPHGALWNLEGHYLCSLIKKINMKPMQIPDFCPLENYVKEIPKG